MSVANQSSPSKVPLLEAVVQRRKRLQQSRDALSLALINISIVIFFFIDIKCSLISAAIIPKLFDSLFYMIEIFLTLILFINSIYHCLLYSWPYLWMKPIEVNENEMRLLRIKPNELGFKVMKSSANSSPIKSHSNTPRLSSNFPPTPSFEIVSPSSLSSSLQQQSSLSPFNTTVMSNMSVNPSPNVSALSGLSNSSFNTSMNTTSSSWVYHRGDNSILGTSSPNDESPKSNANSLLRLRKINAKVNSSNNTIIDEKSLDQYLREYEMREERDEEIRKVEKDQELSNSSSPWSTSMYNAPMAIDQSISYQLSIQSPLSSTRGDEIDKSISLSSSHSSRAFDAILTKLKITETQMNQWIENIRKWMCQTILTRLVSEIDKINEILVKMGSVDSLIGEASLTTIKQISTLKKAQISTFEAIIPYLDVTVHQQYLVKRIKDLAKGGCMSEFNWNGGGFYNRKMWSEELPTDSAIVMHAFCAYMDSRLPSNPNSPEGKAFTNQYFQTISGSVPKGSIFITQIKVNPPHYKVISHDDDTWELPLGRNNLFHTLLVFIHCVKVKHFGLLGRINLGPSGVNILWVIDSKY